MDQLAHEQSGNNNNHSLSLKRNRDESYVGINPTTTTTSDGKDIAPPGSDQGEVTRRPAGSKNKPKPPIIITRDSANALRSYVMEIANDCDIQESISTFATRRQRGVCILSGSDTVTPLQSSLYTEDLRSSRSPDLFFRRRR